MGALKLKQNHDYEANETEIKALLAQARSKGFEYAGENFVKKIPDSDNAWIEIGPKLMEAPKRRPEQTQLQKRVRWHHPWVRTTVG